MSHLDHVGPGQVRKGDRGPQHWFLESEFYKIETLPKSGQIWHVWDKLGSNTSWHHNEWDTNRDKGGDPCQVPEYMLLSVADLQHSWLGRRGLGTDPSDLPGATPRTTPRHPDRGNLASGRGVDEVCSMKRLPSG